MNYRADIQILRGVSVILVVLFHLGFSSIQSGFLGVDVFFVISGFLMAVLYTNSDISSFYLRRARRLLPAYYATILFTLVFSYIFTTPNETSQVDTQVKYALGFLSNIGFWMQNSYFSNSNFNPLLHLWSLGVEIQFYLIVPVLYWFFQKLRGGFWLILIGSMISCFFIVSISPKTSFFMMPLRLWEFLIGYGVAHFLTNKGNIKLLNYKWLGLLGLLIVFIIPLFSVNGEVLNAVQGHPGLFALLVTLATAVVLALGIPDVIEESVIAKLLEKIGKYSYSIYLAHFPVIVIYLSKPFEGTNLAIPTLKDGFILFVLICISSALLYYFFEHKRLKINIKTYAAYATALLITATVTLPNLKNQFYTQEELAIFDANLDRGDFRCGEVYQRLESFITSCDLTESVKNPTESIMLVGNSHSDSIKDSFKDLAVRNNIKLYIPISNTFLTKGLARPKSIVNDAINNNVTKIVIHSSPNSISKETIIELIQLSKEAQIKVFFIEPVPVWETKIPPYMYAKMHGLNVHKIQQDKNDYLKSNHEELSFIRSIESSNFKTVPIVEYFCDPNCIYASNEGKPLYFDSHHLTITGSHKLSKALIEIIND